ncbi:hypothetical protein [Pseudonocardia hydrocarbonoxydans]|uniref:Uncharacterized protein n=1 Tax=Pseudonocardia hydrocarbonoxydans TaxID=76726 RepID=A0A4Y3WS54_9PSEU|nr:hypothetical protein [Pseudonocardia hydrocarbonoxydans]GEC20186.1 hypothetical protein PHY01_24690 [Pseudonocardia hydrocarbonoxydans]
MATAVLVGGPWDGHTEEVALDDEGLPPRLLPRFRDTTIYTEDTGYMPVRIPERAYRLRDTSPSESGTWLYEPDLDDPLA